MPAVATPPLDPFLITLDAQRGSVTPAGPVVRRRLSDLAGLFADSAAWQQAVADDDHVVYEVASSPVPEADGELAQSITTLYPGAVAGELYMTKGHMHPNPRGEIYLSLGGSGGLLLFDGRRTEWLELAVGEIGYIPPNWAHRSVNIGDEPYRFLAVYPGDSGHDYEWVVTHGMGNRVTRSESGVELVPYVRS